MTTLRQETIVESKGDNALERMVHHVLHHKPPAEPIESSTREREAEAEQGAAAAAAAAVLFPL